MSLSLLPNDILELIFKYLDIFNIRKVYKIANKNMRNILVLPNTNNIWLSTILNNITSLNCRHNIPDITKLLIMNNMLFESETSSDEDSDLLGDNVEHNNPYIDEIEYLQDHIEGLNNEIQDKEIEINELQDQNLELESRLNELNSF